MWGITMIIMKNSLPVHAVTLDDFYMDATEATNAQYQFFLSNKRAIENRVTGLIIDITNPINR